MDEYTYETYGTARFHIPDGLYSMEEIEKLLANMKAAKKQAEKSLKRSMKPIYGEHMIDEDDDTQVYRKPWVALTDEEIGDIFNNTPNPTEKVGPFVIRFSRAIEAALKKKNT